MATRQTDALNEISGNGLYSIFFKSNLQISHQLSFLFSQEKYLCHQFHFLSLSLSLSLTVECIFVDRTAILQY